MESIIRQLEFNYKYALDLISDVEEENMAVSPSPGLENHPAFTIGHIITAYGLLTRYLGGPYTIPKPWDELFRRRGPGDPRRPDRDKNLYPSKSELTAMLNEQHALLLEYLDNCTEESLEAPVEWRYANYFPSTRDLILFSVGMHYAMHLGQLAAWRRAMGMESSLGRL